MQKLCIGILSTILLSFCAVVVQAAEGGDSTKEKEVGLPKTFPKENWEMAKPKDQGLSQKEIDALMAYLEIICGGKEGVSQAMLIRNGYVLWQGDDIDNLHPIWSCTKSFASICFGLLSDDKKINPDNLIKDYDPALAEFYPEVTLYHLGTFADGIKSKKGERYNYEEPRFAPGANYHYSRSSDILTYAMTKAAGKPLAEFFQERVAGPLQIDSASWEWKFELHPDGTKVHGGAGVPTTGMHMTANSLARVGWLMANDGVWDGQQILSKEYIQWATKNHWDVTTRSAYDEKGWYRHLENCYGFNFWVNGVRPNGEKMWRHAPGGTYAFQGNRNNICIVIPAWNMVFVRCGVGKNIDCDHYDVIFSTLHRIIDKKK